MVRCRTTTRASFPMTATTLQRNSSEPTIPRRQEPTRPIGRRIGGIRDTGVDACFVSIPRF